MELLIYYVILFSGIFYMNTVNERKVNLLLHEISMQTQSCRKHTPYVMELIFSRSHISTWKFLYEKSEEKNDKVYLQELGTESSRFPLIRKLNMET